MLNNAEKAIAELALMLEVDANTECVKDAVLELLRYKDDVEMTMVAEGDFSLRGQEWVEFSNKVLEHIENYVIPQYGDKGQDQVTEYTPYDCILQNRKYISRYGHNQREGQDELDLLKSAHYVCLAYTKLREKESED